MKFIPQTIPDVVLIEPRVFGDDRGFFMETWHAGKFADAGLDIEFVQDNHSKSTKNVLRGLHYQLQRPQGKLVRVMSGIVFDVAVDMRRSSPTFGQWVGTMLSAENKSMLWVPPGFAHGFLTCSETAEFVYKCSDLFAPEHERVLRWDDPDVGIEWPLADGEQPSLSTKDGAGDSFADADVYP